MSTSVGMWVWQVNRCEGGDIDRIVAKCKDHRLGHLLIKTNDGRGDFNGTLGPLVKTLQGEDIHVWSWTYTYGRYPEQEAEVFALRSLALEVNGLCVDAEVEYKGQAQAAERFMYELRKHVAENTLPVMLSSFYRPVFHPTFPWRQFLEQCDYVGPQVYWYSNPPDRAVQRSWAEFTPYGVPIFPSGATYPEATGVPKNIGTFLRECDRLGARQVDFWSWQHATPAMWEEIRDYATA